jgi:LPXTG-motif cell wall-anchored protein
MFVILVAGFLLVSPATVDAQSETVSTTKHSDSDYTVELRSATVITTYGNHVVVENQDGEYVDFEVPEGHRFNIDGRQLRVSELKPGTKVSAMVKTTTTTQKVVTTTVREGQVLRVVGRTVIIRGPDGVKKHVVPSDFLFTVDGQERTVDQLREGMIVTATIVSESSPATLTERELASEISGTAPRTARASSPPPPAPAARPATLPSTGSSLPLIGLAGLASLLLGLGIAAIRRF